MRKFLAWGIVGVFVCGLVLGLGTMVMAEDKEPAKEEPKAAAPAEPAAPAKADAGAKAPTEDLTFTNVGDSDPVVFSHAKHAAKNTCDDCHGGATPLFQQAKSGKPLGTMKEMYEGKACGTCHNGEKAFKAKVGCGKCHIEGDEEEGE